MSERMRDVLPLGSTPRFSVMGPYTSSATFAASEAKESNPWWKMISKCDVLNERQRSSGWVLPLGSCAREIPQESMTAMQRTFRMTTLPASSRKL